MTELQILDGFQKLHNPILDSIMIFITSLGNVGFIWLAITAVLLMNKKTRTLGILLAIAVVINTILCNGLIKPIVARTRPYEVNSAVSLLISKPLDYSFPSGHTAISFTVVSVLYFLRTKKYWILAFILASLIAFSRMYLYVHYPTDVLAGAIVGTFSGWITVKWSQSKYRRFI